MDLLIKNVKIVDYSGEFHGDVYIKEGKISEIGLGLEKSCDVIEGNGKTLMPAFVDLHCHFRDPGLTHKEDIETGSKAAVKGGYTTVNLMGNTKPTASSMEVYDYVVNKGKEVGLCDLNQCITVTENLDGKTLSHLDNIDSKVKFLTDDGRGVQNNKVMYEAMVKAKEMGVGIMSHAEDDEILPISHTLAENLMTIRDIELAKYTGAHLHLSHVSTKEALDYIMNAKDEGYDNITCEVTPHHIALNDEIKYRVNPPLRSEEDRMMVIEAIKMGYIDGIGTDHAPHTEEDKANGAPGISGIEVAFSMCYSALVKEGHITVSELSNLMSKKPAELMKINKGAIKPGFEGDVVLVDEEAEITIDSSKFESKGKNTPLNGSKYFGEVLMTVKGGKIVYKK